MLDVGSKQLSQLGLEALECAEGQQLDFERGNVASIIGHPVGREKRSQHPLRIAYGKEMEDQGYAIRFTYDSISGNSGSPVFGRGYKVKEIHVFGQMAEDGTKKGSAMKLSNVRKCILYAFRSFNFQI